jgi:hypothetical protein
MLHSKLGASSAHRWMNCPGSVKLSQDIPQVTSKYAEEGTLAHEIAAHTLTMGSWPVAMPPEMKEPIELYINQIYDDAKLEPDAPGIPTKMMVEHKFDLSSIHPGMFGTADCVTYDQMSGLLRVYDFKYGQGIAVDVVENEQLMYYGLGALLSLNLPCKEVELVIIQPRCPHPDGIVRRWRFNSIELLDFAETLRLSAEATSKPDAPLQPGVHCKFCPAAAVCPAVHSKAIEAAQNEFSPSMSYDPEKLAKTLEMLDMVEDWAKNVREFAYREALHGRVPPGYKLVQKRASRQWKIENEEELELALHEKLKVPKRLYWDYKFKSPAQVEKLLPKNSKKLLEEFVVSRSTGTKLVPLHESGEPVLLDAASEFEVIAKTVNQGEHDGE